MAAKKQMEKEYDKWQGSEFKKGMIISSWSAWQAATAIAEEKLKSDNKPMPKKKINVIKNTMHNKQSDVIRNCWTCDLFDTSGCVEHCNNLEKWRECSC